MRSNLKTKIFPKPKKKKKVAPQDLESTNRRVQTKNTKTYCNCKWWSNDDHDTPMQKLRMPAKGLPRSQMSSSLACVGEEIVARAKTEKCLKSKKIANLKENKVKSQQIKVWQCSEVNQIEIM